MRSCLRFTLFFFLLEFTLSHKGKAWVNSSIDKTCYRKQTIISRRLKKDRTNGKMRKNIIALTLGQTDTSWKYFRVISYEFWVYSLRRGSSSCLLVPIVQPRSCESCSRSIKNGSLCYSTHSTRMVTGVSLATS